MSTTLNTGVTGDLLHPFTFHSVKERLSSIIVPCAERGEFATWDTSFAVLEDDSLGIRAQVVQKMAFGLAAFKHALLESYFAL